MDPNLDLHVMEPDAFFGDLRLDSLEDDTVVIAHNPRIVLR